MPLRSPYHKGSVLPRVAGTRTPQGQMLVIDRTKWHHAATLYLLVALLVTVLAIGFLRLRRAPNDFRTVSRLIAAASVFAAAFIPLWRIRHLRRAFLLVRPWPLRFGDEARAELRVYAKKHASSVAGRLACIEQAKKDTGTKYESTKSALLYAIDLPTATLREERKVLRAEWTFTVPEGLPPSFATRSHKIQWLLDATVTTEDSEIPVHFELIVIPESVT